MISSVRARLSALIACALLTAFLLGAGSIATVVSASRSGLFHDVRTAIIISCVVLLVGLIVICLVVLTSLLKPITSLANASTEVVRGRHPDEALAHTKLRGEVAHIAEGMREMALKLREIDANDRRYLMSVSHELRTPLTAITGHIQAIEDFADNADVREQSLTVIKRETARLERLIEDIVDLARLRSNRFTVVTEEVWLDELGEHLLEIFADSGSDLKIRGEFERVLIHSDGQRILQIVRNLVANGRRYAESYVSVVAIRVGNRVHVNVTNDGALIPDDDHERIFEPFIGKKREGGMGLGLAIGRELAWALGGNLVCLPCSYGAHFELTLPIELPGYAR